MSTFHTRAMTLPNGTAVRTASTRVEAELTDEELFERYPAVAEIMVRWTLERMSDAEQL